MAAAEVEDAVPAGGADEIKPYRIHVSHLQSNLIESQSNRKVWLTPCS